MLSHSQKQVSADFPFHHLQHLRRPTTHYSLLATNYGNTDWIEAKAREPGAFLAYDSKYDPAFDPCRDCDDSGYGGEYCNYGKCYFEKIFLVGRN